METSISKLDVLPSYEDNKISLEKRARSYLHVNYAHCHSPQGVASDQTLSLDYRTPLGSSGLMLHQQAMPVRMKVMGEYHMPKLGTTVPDREGLS
ncbi:hypothetical protein [Desertivirga xinjiangensis]|uniref:hypothetical protein n=1 Tax=Desertivirga xinjiangensis TaxID=539206 RepID=UPI00210E1129|nr:hypothetical protein [Pedobacter xinjiangensis]